MSDIRLSRRIFLAGAGALAAGALFGCGGGGGAAADPTVMWQLSGRGRRISNAAKAHNANKRFATFDAALAHRAHAGDTSTPVSLDVKPETWALYFGDGTQVVDLRRL